MFWGVRLCRAPGAVGRIGHAQHVQKSHSVFLVKCVCARTTHDSSQTTPACLAALLTLLLFSGFDDLTDPMRPGDGL
ncbi:hypothetical protein E2C01_071673 [Portunus trituberculatus]|uniref:Uncharacterized protein n=1 Tax=Portunus trituberculatus TaxID=210409 RepID=A0A5B7I8V1_PORTR|nr:hypothetical protein [Portunus trituberculatus]